MARWRDDFEEDDEEQDEEDLEEQEQDSARNRDLQPPRIGGSHRRPLRDREFPVESTDFTDDGTDPCPRCGKPIYADGEWCPHCGEYLSQEDAPSQRSLWLLLVVGALILLALMGVLIGR
jgi:predicted nucleic acid-binding Zn ribbon protein